MGENESATGLAITIPEEVFNDLDRLEGKIKSLEVITNDVSKKIVASFLKMANGVDPFIKKVELAGKSLSNMFPSGNEQMEKFMSSLVDVANALNRLGSGRQPVTGTLGDPDEVARLTSELKKQQQEIDRLNRSIDTLRKQRKSSAAEERAATTAETTFRRAMFATEATMNQRINKIAKLREAERQLTATGRDYSEQIRTIRAEMDRLNRINQQAVATTDRVRKSQRHLMDISGQLMRRLALVFSVSQMTQYVQKLAQTRGEFELQNAALTAILQNKDEADQLFGQITQLAVQSPFQLKELVTYTKELAAYRIENEKLYDTTKMLADVSAGLGVDMSRLILAYGQVKAANYLRGTELRQFSEAGINILGELATYFSEIENRAVSVGEVFEMVSNRMVTFQDVEEIFRRITSDGGIFANMQEVQARTLAGMISNMQDSVDVMLNEIGKSNEGILKGAVEAVADLMINWREVVSMMQKAAVVLGPIATYFTLSKVATTGFAQSLFNLGTRIPVVSNLIENMMGLVNRANRYGPIAARAANGLVTALGGLATAGITVAIAAISGGIMKLWQEATRAHREMKQLNKELDQIINTDFSNISDSVTIYKELIEKLKDVNKGSGEHRDLIAQINSKYGEYLGYIVTETTSYEQLKASIDAVTESMMRRARMATEEKALQAVYEQQADIISESQDAIREALTSQPVSGINRRATEKELQDIFRLIEDYVKETGQILTESDFDTILDEYYNTDIKFYDIALKKLRQYSKAVLTTLRNEEIANARINSIYGERYDSEKARAEIEQNNKTWQAELKAAEQRSDLTKWELEQLQKAIDQRYKLQEIDLKVKYDVLTPEEGERQKQQLLKWATQTVEDVNKQVTENLTSQGFSDELISRFLITPDMQSTGMPEIEKTVIASYRQASESIERFNRLKAAGNKIDEQQLQTVLNQQKGWYAVAEALGIVDMLTEKSGKASDDTLTRLKTQIDAIKRAGQAYREALKIYNETDAAEKIRADYQDLFDSVGIGDMIGTMQFDASGMIAAYNRLLVNIADTAAGEAKTKLDAAIAEVRGEINVKIRTEQIDEVKSMFDNLMSGYNVSAQLDYTGLDKDAIAKMFGIEETSIEDIRKRITGAWVDAANEQEKLLAEMYGRAAVVYTDLESAVASFGEQGIKAFSSQIEAMDKALADEQKKWMNKFIEFLSQSVNEIQQVQNEGMTGIGFAKQFFDEGKLSAEQYGVVVKRIIQDVNKQISNINLEKFKDSPEYIQAMGDLSAYSYAELERLLGKLRELVATSAKNMDAEDMKTYMDAINRIQDQMDNMKSPVLENEVAQLIRLKELEDQFNDAQAEHSRLLEEREEWLRKVADAQERLNRLQNERQNGNQSQQLSSMIDRANADLLEATEGLSEADSAINASQSNLSSISGMIGQITKGAGSALTMVDLIIKAVYNSIKATVELFQEVKELADSFGADTESGRWSDAGLVFDMIGNFNESAMQGWERLKSGDVLGATVSTLSSIFDIIKGINALRDNQREKVIQSETEKVEELAEAYDDLADSIDKINNAAKLEDARAQLEENIRKQVEAYDKMIAAEKDKKNPDEDQIKEWEKAQEDVIKQGQDDMEALLEKAGGVAQSDYLSSAEEFVDAWLQAFRETGDGLSGLKDNFDDFFLNILTRQAALTIAQPLIDSILGEINKAIQDDSMISVEEGQDIRKKWEEIAPTLDENLRNFFSAFMDIIGTAEGSLSGLQKGIQGVTEETAQIIEALLNSMRYYTADSNLQLRNIYMILSGNEAMPNPILAELRAQTEQIRAINRLIRNVTASGHPNGGDGIKVFMN